mmetsp:Transcript_36565/g.67008  ORF Transcript_36565/g.67008 Transcript_36565/m.67008 type:complete len:290 (+) Transcript_36565:51-920(+)
MAPSASHDAGFDHLLTSNLCIPTTVKLHPFEVWDTKVGNEDFQSFQLTEFAGAIINVDLRAVRSVGQPEFQARLRIDSVKGEVIATALREIRILDETKSLWKGSMNAMTISEIKERLQQLGQGHLIEGKSRKADLLATLRKRGKLVKPFFKDDDGNLRIGVRFSERLLHVPPSYVKLSGPVLSTGEHQLGPGSTYVLSAAYLAFGNGAEETTFLLGGGAGKPVGPGALTEWSEPFYPESVVFSTTAAGRFELQAKLKLECRVKSIEREAASIDDADLETPELKRPRLAV